MARPQRDNLIYFPFNVDFFKNRTVRALRSRFGADGITIFVYILCEIYGTKGYYMVWDEDFSDAICDDLHMDENKIKQVLSFLINRSLLTRILVTPDTVYTSVDVQRNYQEARRGAKRDVIVDKNIWLLEKSDTLPFIKVACKDDSLSFSEKNGNKSGIYPQRREEEKKEDIDKNKTKKNRAKSACDDVLKKILEKLESCNIYPSSNTIEAIQSWLSDTDTEVVMYAIDEADKRSKRSWSYVEAILRRLKADGLKTIEQIKERDSNYKASNKRFTDKDTSVFQPDGTDYADIERRMNKLLDEDYDEYAAAGIY